MARNLGVPTGFYDKEKPPTMKAPTEEGWGDSGKDARTLARFRRVLSRTNAADQKLLLAMAQKMASRRRKA